jgi:ribosomal protein S18 acetylase RimI-like enzyme
VQRSHPYILIRNLSLRDVGEVVGLHRVIFPGYNATVVGEPYLTSLYHTLAADSSCLSVAAWVDGQLVGWIGGVKDWPSFVRSVTWRCMPRIFGIVLTILRNRPGLLLRAAMYVFDGMVGLVRGRVEPSEKVEGGSTVGEAALLVIGVHPDHQRMGLAQSMMENFHERLLAEGFSVCTSTTHVDNEHGNRAFVRAGYRLTGTYGRDNRYVKRLSQKGTRTVRTHSKSTG